MSGLRIADTDIPFNAAARLPVCLCLDTSWSMAGDPIRDLNLGVRTFLDEVTDDPRARASAEIAVVTFGGSVRRVADFAPVDVQEVPELVAAGATPMGEGVGQALDLLERQKQSYSQAGMEYFQPWLVLMTDGLPTDSTEHVEQLASQLVTQRKLVVIPVGIGREADQATLRRFSPVIPPLFLREHRFSEFWVWLSRSVVARSRSTPHNEAELDPDVMSWIDALRRQQ